MKIKDLGLNRRGRVLRIVNTNREYREKLLRMGLVRGTEFTVLRKAPLGDPMEIEIRGFNLSLRKDEAEALEIEPLEPSG